MEQLSGKRLAVAVKRAFDVQSDQHDRGKARFDTAAWNDRLAKVLEVEVLVLLLAEKSELPMSTLKQAAKLEALAVAQSMNQTTTEWLDAGRDPEQVFGADRAASAGITEAEWAKNAVTQMVGRTSGAKRKKWLTEAGTTCEQCKSLNGKSVKIDQTFRSKDGTEAQFPPLHPNCRCRLELA